MPTLEEDFQVLPDQFPHGAEPAKSERSLEEDFEPVMQPQEAAQMGIDAVNNINSILGSPAVAAASQAAQEEANRPSKLTLARQLIGTGLKAVRDAKQEAFNEAARGLGKAVGVPMNALHEVLAPPMSTVLSETGIDPSSTPEHVINLPRFTEQQIASLPDYITAAVPGLGTAAKLAPGLVAGEANLAAGTAEALARPENLALMATGLGEAGLASKVASLTLSASQLATLPEAVQRAYEVVKDPNATTAQKVEALGQPGVAAIFAGLLLHAGLEPGSETTASSPSSTPPPIPPPRIEAGEFPGTKVPQTEPAPVVTRSLEEGRVPHEAPIGEPTYEPSGLGRPITDQPVAHPGTVPISPLTPAETTGKAAQAVRQMAAEKARRQDFARAVSEKIKQDHVEALNRSKPLTDNQVRIMVDSLRKAIADNQIPGPNKGLVRGSALEAWADRTIQQSGKRMNMGIDPALATAGIIKGMALVEKGLTDFAGWSAEMVQQFGERIRPHLQALFKASQERIATKGTAIDEYLSGLNKPMPAGTGRTNMANEAGMQAGSIADLDKLAAARTRLIAQSKDLRARFAEEKDPLKKQELFNQAMIDGQMAQYPREAIETAVNAGSNSEENVRLGPRPLDWEKNAEVADWLKKNAQNLNIAFDPNPAKIIQAAYWPRDMDKPAVGPNHPEILKQLGIAGYSTPESRNTSAFGYIDQHGQFLSRERAAGRAVITGQNLKTFEPGEPAHSDEIASPKNPQEPISEQSIKTTPAKTVIAGSDAEAWADKIIKQAGQRFSMGIDPQLAAAGVVKGAAFLERGITEFTQWSARMVEEFGPEVRPYLRVLFEQSKRARVASFKPPAPEETPQTEAKAPKTATKATAAATSPLRPGAAPPAEFEQRPDPEVVNLPIGSPALARLTRQYQNVFAGIRQLFARRGAKRDMMSLMNAANGLADVAGLRAGKAISARATSPEALRALTFVIQALKMSGEGLSADAEERMGQLEFAGDPEGYLRTKQADMETAAQQFAQRGQAVEAHAAKAAAEAMLYARQHFNQLRPAADRFRQITDRQHARLANAGIDVAYENWYVPQRHDLDMFTGADRPIVLGHGGGAGGSTQFKKAKTFEDYASAIEAGFVPRSLGANELLHHYVSTTERLITTKAFFDGLRGVTDPVDGKAVVTDVPRKVIHRADGSIDVQETVPLGYTVHQVTPGVRLAVHNGYSRLIDALTARSQLAQSAAFGTLQDIAAFEKHIGLALDTFHASRVMQTELAMTGKLSVGERQRLGRALVEYSPADLDAAVQAGEITQEMADFIRRPQEMQINGKTMKLSPANVFMLGLRNGLNVGRFADVIYRQWLRDIPGVGHINRWVFDKQTRAATANGFAAEFERVAAARPDLTANEVARTVARDVNVFFGNLQKESIFRNPSLRTILQVVFLAPEWVQGMARREGRAPLQLVQAGVALAKGEPVHLGTAARTMGRGLAAYIVGTQLLNLITRHQLTFYNQERGHKLDAWVPIGKHGFFLSPLSVFGEITHDLVRLAETKPDFASVLTRIGANKLGNIGRAIGIIATGRDPFTGDKIIGTSRRAMRAALQLVPTPITISQPLQAAGAALGVARPPQEGAVARQVASSLGFKTEPAPTPGQQIYHLAQSWMRTASPRMQADAQRRLQEDFGPSDYRDLRSALAKDDLAGARKAYQTLRQQGKTPKQIRQTIQHPHPFTGSATGERQFRASLSPEDRKLYDQAIQDRRKLYQQFQQMLNTQTR